MAAGQRDEVDVRAVGERLADPSARSQDEVDDARRDARLLEQADEMDGRQRRDRAGFTTIVLPAASAGATFQLTCSSG